MVNDTLMYINTIFLGLGRRTRSVPALSFVTLRRVGLVHRIILPHCSQTGGMNASESAASQRKNQTSRSPLQGYCRFAMLVCQLPACEPAHLRRSSVARIERATLCLVAEQQIQQACPQSSRPVGNSNLPPTSSRRIITGSFWKVV